jgi:hypothetical protein
VIWNFLENNYHLDLARRLKRKKMQQIGEIRTKTGIGIPIAGTEYIMYMANVTSDN